MLIQLGRTLALNIQHILDTFKIGLPCNVCVNLVTTEGMLGSLNMTFTRGKCNIQYFIYGSLSHYGMVPGITNLT